MPKLRGAGSGSGFCGKPGQHEEKCRRENEDPMEVVRLLYELYGVPDTQQAGVLFYFIMTDAEEEDLFEDVVYDTVEG